jgi:hypothetical protein
MALVLKFASKALTNVDDPAGLWQFEAGSVTRGNQHVANYSSIKRVTFNGTDQDGQNTANLTITIFFIGSHPPESITLAGAHDFSSGNETGSVSAASSTQKAHIGKQFTRNGASDVVEIS